MKPALSVILFTVLSGAGLGVLALTGFVVVFRLPWLFPERLPHAVALGLALTVAGLLSSTLHLANPRNAWRAFARFRTSWLSREGVFSMATFKPSWGRSSPSAARPIESAAVANESRLRIRAPPSQWRAARP